MSNGDTSTKLVEAFGIKEGEIVAIVGGGGKSSLMFALTSQWSGPAVATTTTKIFRNQINQAPANFAVGDANLLRSADIRTLNRLLMTHGSCLVYGKITGEKAHGISQEIPRSILEQTLAEIIVVESDGSRMRPCKAPADHEPAVPIGTSLMIPTIGIDALNRPLAEAAHRPELVARITGRSQNDLLDEDDLVKLLIHPEGGLKNAPDNAKVIVFINKVESKTQLNSARIMSARILKEPTIDRVVLGSLHDNDQVFEVHRRVMAVVLAAGKSSRMGVNKQLLPWGNRTILGQTLFTLLGSKVNEIQVVVGANSELVESEVEDQSISTLFNPDYESGEMLSSLKIAISQAAENIGAVLVVLADQPTIPSAVIDQLLKRYWLGDAQLIAPTFEGNRGNPVLIGRPFFEDIMKLSPGDAPRDMLANNEGQVTYIDVDSPAILQDIDRPEDYERWRPRD